MHQQHRFAQYPYQQTQFQAPLPGYVGPAWAAPMPRRPQQPKARGMSGCLIAVIVLGVLFGVGFLLFVAAIALAISVGGGSESEETHPTTTSTSTSTAGPAATLQPVQPTGMKGGLPSRTAVDANLFDRTARADYASAGCVDPKFVPEEARNYYSLYYRNHGTAKRLRGKVALVHLRIMSPDAVWTMRSSSDVDRAALLAGHFFTEQAALHGVTDLEYVPMTWSLTTDYVPPKLLADHTGKISSAASREVVAQGLRASEASIGLTTEAIAKQLQSEGYNEVAFLLHIPVKSVAREFAFPAPLHGNVDVAVVFSHPDLPHLAYTTTHESLHLFGADDLYPITRRDEDDAHDMMHDYCLGFGNARIGSMTAYAIGWSQTIPTRPYTIR